MADPLSISASIIAVIGTTYSAAKTLHDTVRAIREGPKSFKSLSEDLENVYSIIEDLQAELEKRSAAGVKLTPAQGGSLSASEKSLITCRQACQEFQNYLMRYTIKEGRLTKWSAVKLHFNEEAIAGFQAKLRSYNETFSLGLEFLIYQVTGQTLEATERLETKFVTAEQHITAQLEGLRIGQQTVLGALTSQALVPSQQQQQQLNSGSMQEFQNLLVQAFERQTQDLWYCLQTYAPALKATTDITGNKERLEEVVRTGNIYKGNLTFDEAQMINGNVGEWEGPSNKYVNNQAHGRSKMIQGNIKDAGFLKDFLK